MDPGWHSSLPSAVRCKPADQHAAAQLVRHKQITHTTTVALAELSNASIQKEITQYETMAGREGHGSPLAGKCCAAALTQNTWLQNEQHNGDWDLKSCIAQEEAQTRAGSRPGVCNEIGRLTAVLHGRFQQQQ